MPEVTFISDRERGSRWLGDTDQIAVDFWKWASDGRYGLGDEPYRFLPHLDVAVSEFLHFHLHARLNPRDSLALQKAVQEIGPSDRRSETRPLS